MVNIHSRVEPTADGFASITTVVPRWNSNFVSSVIGISARGYHAVYHDGEINHCPGCGRTHWLIGRLSAECAFCSTALPLKEAANRGPSPTPVFWSGTRPSYA